MANLYFTESPLNDGTTEVTLVDGEARHAVQVARLRVGETVQVSDGHGARATGSVTFADTSLVRLTVSDFRVDEPHRPQFVLVQALAKGDRDELAIQTTTELGVDVVVPWQAERSVSRWVGDKVDKGVARWRTIVTEAAKQSMRSSLPVVLAPVATAQIPNVLPEATWLVLDPRAELSLKAWCDAAPSVQSVGVIVGPEGGIAESEIDVLVAAGATRVRIAPDVLRTSTAGPAAFAVLGTLLRGW